MNVILCEEMKDVLLFNFHWKIKALSIVNGEEHMICADFQQKDSSNLMKIDHVQQSREVN